MNDGQAPAGTPAAPVFDSGFCAPDRRGLILLAAILASSLGFIDGAVISIAIPAIRAALDASLVEAQWVHNAYMLTLAALILAGGALADRFGLARVFGAGIALFVAASMLCAVAPNAPFLIAARAVQGLGAAVMVPGSLALIARAYPRQVRGRAIGIWAAASAMTTAFGPILGGVALTFGGQDMWRWIFAINLPLGALAVALLRRAVRHDPGQPGSPVDLPGAALATTAFFCLAWGLTATHIDGGPPALVWLGTGFALLLAFVAVEARSACPMMPLALFRNRGFTRTNLLSFVLYGGLNMVFFYLPMTMIAGWGISEIMTSLAFSPMAVFIALLSPRMGALADRLGPAPLLCAGALILALGYGYMGWSAARADLWRGVFPAMCAIGLGMSLVVAPLSAAVMSAVDEARSGLASGVNNAAARLSGLFSVAAGGALVALAYRIAGGPLGFGETSGLAAHRAAMSAGLAAIAWTACGLSLLSALLALSLRR
jgi:EmrB/QacA subfamily drug resistance transporter